MSGLASGKREGVVICSANFVSQVMRNGLVVDYEVKGRIKDKVTDEWLDNAE